MITKPIHFAILMSEPPGPTSQFIEVEDMGGKSFKLGEWSKRNDGNWELLVDCSDIYNAGYEAGNRSGSQFPNHGN